MDKIKELKKRKGKIWDYMYSPEDALIRIPPKKNKDNSILNLHSRRI
ncbi:MAG: hypothetical protein PQ975_05735 [Methanobacterium sp.]|jgi:hypothetical protein